MSVEKIYIAGKITGDPDYKKKFAAAQREREEQGFIVLNPAWTPQGLTSADYMRMCFAMIDTADTVVFLPGYETSAGAMLELKYCDYTEKPYLLPYDLATAAACDKGHAADSVDNVNHPAHYQGGRRECIDEMIAMFGVEAVKAFCCCNVYKYRYRADRKNGAEDIAKAEWYMDKLIELERQTVVSNHDSEITT